MQKDYYDGEIASSNLHAGKHTIAVLHGEEQYETLAQGFKEVFEEINETIAEEYLTINRKRYRLEIFLGGDYKVYTYTLKIQKH